MILITSILWLLSMQAELSFQITSRDFVATQDEIKSLIDGDEFEESVRSTDGYPHYGGYRGSQFSPQRNCQRVITLSPGQTIFLKSPNYPNQYYNWARCRWLVRAKNTLIHFSCDDFSLAQSELCNIYSDFLLVESKGGAGAGGRGRWYCASDVPEDIDASVFLITFWSNYGGNDRGFSCALTAYDNSYSSIESTFAPSIIQPAHKPISPTAIPPSSSVCRCGRSTLLNESKKRSSSLSEPFSNFSEEEIKNNVSVNSLKESNSTELLRSRRQIIRVVNGEVADIHEFPWLALILYPSNTTCGGTLINEQFVLTAAHCILTGSDLPIVYLGEHSRSQTGDTPHTRRYTVDAAIRHDSYGNFDNDIALLRLTFPLKLHQVYPFIAPVCPPQETNSYAGKTATVAGWGYLDESGSFPTDVVNKADVRIVDRTTCQQQLSASANNLVTENMICAGGDGKDACTNDSGGPLMIKDEGRWILIGIVSWGVGCGRPNLPGVYTRVDKYMKWIGRRIGNARTCIK